MGETEDAAEPLDEIADGLLRLRRMWARPDVIRKIRAQSPEGPGGRPLQLSNLMVVHAVAELGDAPGVVTVGAVAERLDIDPSTASRLVGHAIDAGLVSRQPSLTDARRADLRLTEAGQRVREVADQSHRDFIARLMADWSADERAQFARLLTRLTEAAARIPPDPDGVSRIFREAAAASSHNPARGGQGS